MNGRMRRVAIGPVGAAAVALAWFAPSAQEELSLPKVARGAQESAAAPASRLAVLPQRDGIGAPKGGELFDARTWTPPAPKHAPAAVVAPTAPPNPYKLAGRFVQGGEARIFLTKGERVQEAKAGEDLEEGFRVESITEDNVVLVYVPLGTKEVLSIASQLGADLPVADGTPSPSRRRRHAASFRAEAE